MSQTSPEQYSSRATSDLPVGGCVHCGEPCPDDAFSLDGKSFCCLGCQTVFSLLRENGLEQFYELNSRAGRRIGDPATVAKWNYLDEAAVRQKLLDYSDGTRAKVTLHLPAIHCVACVWLLENLFKLHAGVGSSVVNFTRREASITYDPNRIKLSELVALLTSIGYEPEFTLNTLEKPRVSSLGKKTWLQIGIAGFAFGNIMLMSLPFYFGLDSFNGHWFKGLAGWLSLALALPVITFSASDFWKAAWFGLRQRRLTLEVPIALGLTSVYAASVFEVVTHQGPGYFDTLCGLVFFLLCGRAFQRKTHDWLTFDRDYKGFFPLSVTRLTEKRTPIRQSESAATSEHIGPESTTSLEEQCVAISQLQVGDRIILRNGELLPADARLISGEACVDYSFVTGESEPVRCAAGSHLYAGGRQVGGAIQVQTLKPVAQSYLASLWNSDAFRKERTTDLDTLTNRFGKYFTQLVIGIALAAMAGWLFVEPAKSLKVFISVLIVACPCALALAAPVTHGTAQRLLARLRIFLKNAMVMERMAGVDTIVLDKTGTLTSADCRDVRFNGRELLPEEAGWIASLARLSTHPNAVRIAKSFADGKWTVTDFKETPGSGIEGEVAGHKIRLGSHAWLKQSGMLSRDDMQLTMAQAGSTVFLSIDGSYRGGFTLKNSLRPEVEQLIPQLGSRFKLALLSGDTQREAARFQRFFGSNADLHFNQSPADKLDFIRKLQEQGRTVMMVGDGLNDAGALKQADVGVAVVEDIGAFSPASDVILDASELPRLARVLQFSRRASVIVRLGFLISAIYNVVGIGIAAAGILSPLVCAILMPVSSITLVVFTTGATAWAGRRFKAKANQNTRTANRDSRSFTIPQRLVPEEVL